jgi:hypothetical protein
MWSCPHPVTEPEGLQCGGFNGGVNVAHRDIGREGAISAQYEPPCAKVGDDLMHRGPDGFWRTVHYNAAVVHTAYDSSLEQLAPFLEAEIVLCRCPVHSVAGIVGIEWKPDTVFADMEQVKFAVPLDCIEYGQIVRLDIAEELFLGAAAS